MLFVAYKSRVTDDYLALLAITLINPRGVEPHFTNIIIFAESSFVLSKLLDFYYLAFCFSYIRYTFLSQGNNTSRLTSDIFIYTRVNVFRVAKH